MFIFQLASHSPISPEISPTSSSLFPNYSKYSMNRSVKEDHICTPTFASALKKLRMAEEAGNWTVGVFKNIKKKNPGINDEDYLEKCHVVLEDMGFDEPEAAYISLVFSEYSARANKARMQIYDLKKLSDAFGNKQLTYDNALEANIIASKLYAENEKCIFWASKDWAKRGLANYLKYFTELVDSYSFIGYASVKILYNMRFEWDKKKPEYIVNSRNSTLDADYKSILPSKIGLKHKISYELICDYEESLNDFKKSIAEVSQRQTSNYFRRKKISDKDLPLGLRASYWLDPYVKAAT
ncbi:MAG: hypothetical protein ABIH83_00825, partial [Candidatus Micrarchaeota archaeon]